MRPRRARRIGRPFVLALAVLTLTVALFGPSAGVARRLPAVQTGEETAELFVTFLRDGKVASAKRIVELDPGKQVGRASLLALLEGPSEEERAAGLTTAIPSGTELLGLTIDQETKGATVDLSAEFAEPYEAAATPETDEAPPSARARLAQVVYTLTQFPTVETVVFLLDGQPVETFDPDGEGGEEATELTGPVGRADFEDVTPLIFVISPTVGEAIASPVRVYGTANTFEAVFFLQVLDGDGNVLVEQRVMATSGSGTRGTFDVEVPFEFAEPGPGTLVAFDRSPRDGAIENLVEIPVVFVRPGGP